MTQELLTCPPTTEDTPVQIHFLSNFLTLTLTQLSKKAITNLSNLIQGYKMETGQKEPWNTLWEWQQFSEKNGTCPERKEREENGNYKKRD